MQEVLAPTFDLDREVGRGGMGIVYRAVDRRLKRPVAVKVLPPDLAFRAEIRTRFLQEAETAAQLAHPNIVPIYAVDERGGLVYFVMAFVDGETLAQRLKGAGGPLPPAEARRILREVASALAYAHSRGVIHRDIKPDNILLATDRERVMVTDFGIARAVTAGTDSRLTATGVAIGTPAYMSPEQCAGDREIDGRSDLYSLGVVGYQMLTGVLPFAGGNTAALLVKQLSEAPVPIQTRAPAVPAALAAVVMRLLAKAPADRFPDAQALVHALDDARVLAPGPAAPDRSQAAAPRAAAVPPGNAQPFAAPGGPAPPLGRAPLHPPPPASPAAPPFGRVPLQPPAPIDYTALLANPRLSKRARKRLTRQQEADRVRTPKILDSDPRDVKIRKFRGHVVQAGGTILFLSALSLATSPHFFWAIFPDLGIGLGLWRAAGRLWADGISMADVFRQTPAAPAYPPPAYPTPAPALWAVPPGPPPRVAPPPAAWAPEAAASALPASAAKLAPAQVLAGPFGGAVRRAALDRDRIHDLVAQLDTGSRGQVPNADATAQGLAKQVGALAAALHRIDVDTPPQHRPALAERRQALSDQLDRASILLQTLYLDLVRLRVSDSSGADGVAGVTEQASALSRDIGYLLGAADELRALDGRDR